MEKTDVLIIGSGIAGLSLAVELNTLRPELQISIITKAAASEGNSRYAQGGIAAVMNRITDSYENHIIDTLKCGRGLCDEKVVAMVVKEAPSRIHELVKLGAHFDRNPDQHLELGLEGGHSAHRIVHHKDKTGFEVESVLLNQIKSRNNVHILDHLTVVDLITVNENTELRCIGAYLFNQNNNSISSMQASAVVLATGGCGQVYMNTTNPEVATGDGYAIAYRAGAVMKNMRFMQFHPTSLYQGSKRGVSFLISEALRGYGAHIVDDEGKRFLFLYDERGELATRDIVSAAIQKHMTLNGTDCVYLDLRHLDQEECAKRFPQITSHLKQVGYDISTNLIPIVPSAHYQCGGVNVNENGQTNIVNLYAIGEVSCTGLHGANRLASNSLLEALVFGYRAAHKISTYDLIQQASTSTIQEKNFEVATDINDEIEKLTYDLKKRMSAHAFDIDNEHRAALLHDIRNINRFAEQEITTNHYAIALLELRNMSQTAELMVIDMMNEQLNDMKLEIPFEESNI